MKRRLIVVVQLVVSIAGLLAWPAPSEAKPKVEDCVAVQWASTRYDKSVVVNNPAASSGAKNNEQSETLTLSCEIEIGDPNRILGTCDQGTITQLTDSKGRDVPVPQAPLGRMQRYTGLRFHERFAMPPVAPKWQTMIRSALGIRSRPTNTRPQLVTELQPSQLRFQFDMAVLQQAGGEIRRLKGTFHALAVDSFEYVDVPFEPNNTWVRLTGDQEIRVSEAQTTGSSYRFRIDARPQGGMSPFRLTVGSSLPSRLVTDRQLLGADGKPVHRGHGLGMLPASIGGSGSGSGSSGPVKTIRFVIAVNPTDHEIPFELEHIPLPKP